jgi:hypothetical protein
MKRLVAIVLLTVLAACTSSSAPLGLFTGTWVGTADGVTTYTIHAIQTDSVVRGGGTFVGSSESGSYSVTGISNPPLLALTLTQASGSFNYFGNFVTPDSVFGEFDSNVGGISTGPPGPSLSLKRQ